MFSDFGFKLKIEYNEIELFNVYWNKMSNKLTKNKSFFLSKPNQKKRIILKRHHTSLFTSNENGNSHNHEYFIS